MVRLEYDQTPHCCRHTCVSLLATAQVSQTYQKLIVGHKGAMSITESVYTHIEMSELIKAIDSVYYPEEIIKEVKKSKKEVNTMRDKNCIYKQKNPLIVCAIRKFHILGLSV